MKWLATLIVWLLAMCGVAAQTGELRVEDGEWGKDGVISVEFNCPWDGTFDTCGGYATLRVEGMNPTAGRAGEPMLPTMSRVLAVPRGTQLRLTESKLMESRAVALPEGTLIAPTPMAVPKDEEPQPAEPDWDIYGTDAYYRPAEPVTLVHLGTMAGSEVYRLTVAPVEYNPVKGEVRFFTSGEWRVESGEPAGAYNKLSTPNLQLSTYIIVAPPQFHNGLQRFVQWKRQEGFNVVEIYPGTSDCDSIRAMISGHCTLATGYILLVGDAGLIPPFPGTTRPLDFSTHTTDLYYAEHTGDYLPDALLGRWPVNDTAELRSVVDKTLRYEQGLTLDTALLRRALLVAGRESQQPAPVTTNGQVNYVGGLLAETVPGVDTLCYRNPESDTMRAAILDNIADGTALVNYTAHCSASGWSHPQVRHADIDSLAESQPTVYVNNCCHSNAFDGDCFGEHLLRKEHGGGVAVIGATNSTMWNEDYYWAVGPKYPFSLHPEYDSLRMGAFDRWLVDGQWPLTTAGGILAAGNMAVTAFGSPYDKFYWEIYCLLGDPSLRPYLGVPQQLQLAAMDTVRTGATFLRFSLNAPGATVTAVQGDRLLGVATAGADSTALLQLTLPVDTLPLIVTATMPQAIPAMDTVLPAIPQGAALGFRNVAVGDTAIDFTLANVGTDTAFYLTVGLQPDSTGAIFLATLHMVDTLAPGAEMPLHTSITVTEWAPQWSGMLTAQDNAGHACSIPLGHRLGEPPVLTFALLDADGDTAKAVLPNTEYTLSVAVEGEYDSLAVDASAMHYSNEYPLLSTLHSPLSTLHSPLSTLHSQLSTLTTSDSLTHLRLRGHVGRGRYGRDYEYWLTAGGRAESFEKGFDSHPWNLNTVHPWVLDSTVSHSGRYSVRPAQIDHRQTSDLTLDLLLMAEDSIVFWVKMSSEDGDKLSFSVDGQHRKSWSGTLGWQRRAYALTAGRHTLRWRYTKDDSGTIGSDCGWIDDLRLPLALWDSAWGWFDTIADEPGPVGITNSPLSTPNSPLFPNPAGDWVTIGAAGELTLADIYGRTVMSAHTDGHTPLDISALPPGVYIATLRSGAIVHHYKLTKQ